MAPRSGHDIIRLRNRTPTWLPERHRHDRCKPGHRLLNHCQGAGIRDFAYEELKTTIEDLEPDQQVCLVALMWLGRGDFTLED